MQCFLLSVISLQAWVLEEGSKGTALFSLDFEILYFVINFLVEKLFLLVLEVVT